MTAYKCQGHTAYYGTEGTRWENQSLTSNHWKEHHSWTCEFKKDPPGRRERKLHRPFRFMVVAHQMREELNFKKKKKKHKKGRQMANRSRQTKKGLELQAPSSEACFASPEVGAWVKPVNLRRDSPALHNQAFLERYNCSWGQDPAPLALHLLNMHLHHSGTHLWLRSVVADPRVIRTSWVRSRMMRDVGGALDYKNGPIGPRTESSYI